MAQSFAESSNRLMFYRTPSRSDAASLTAIAQQLLKKQYYPAPQQQRTEQSPPWLYTSEHHLLHGGKESWSVLQALTAAGHMAIARPDHHYVQQLPAQPMMSRSSCGADALEDLSCSSSSPSSYLLEPTSVLDHLSSPSLDSNHSPLSLTSEAQPQQFHDIAQSFQEDVCLADQSPIVDVPTASGFATPTEDRATEDRILEENTEDISYNSVQSSLIGIRTPAKPPASGPVYNSSCGAEELQAVRSHGEKVVIDRRDSSSEWIDCLMNEAGSDVGIASCFDRNPCECPDESFQLDDTESWREDFNFACSSEHSTSPTSSWAPHADAQPRPTYASSASWSDQPLFSMLSTVPSVSPAMQQQQAHYPSHLLALPNLWPSQDCESRDVLYMLSRTGLLGSNLERKGGEQGLKLLQLLIDCVKYLDAITMEGSLTTSRVITGISYNCTNTLMALTKLSSPYGDPLQRVTFYFTEAIAAGLENDRLSTISAPTLGQGKYPLAKLVDHDGLENMVMAFRTLNEAVPYIKFAHLTANQAILEATEAAESVHIIDCGIVQGVQWSALLQAFATRPRAGSTKPFKIKITGIASPSLGTEPSISLAATGKRLMEFANLLNLDLEFCPVCEKLEELDPSMIKTDAHEVVAVNFMFHLHHLLDDSLGNLRRALKVVQQLNPVVVTLSEYDVSINALSLGSRFLNAFCFYAAVFDSLDARLAREDPERIKIERLFFAKEIKNMMTVEGAKRKERRESSDKWRRLMEISGFRSKPASPSQFAVNQARLLLRLSYGDNFTLMEGPGWLSLGWLDHPIVRVSAWHCS